MSDHVVFMKDDQGYAQFRITVTMADGYGVSAEVDEVIGWEVDDEHTPAHFERYLTCLIKWDSCAHFNFGEAGEPGYLHLCGVSSFKAHVALMKFLYKLAFELMGREPDGEEWA
jgi:hypothetical protein